VSPRRSCSPAARPCLDRSRFALVRYAIEQLLDASRGGDRFRQGPLCVVAPGGSSRLLDDLAELAGADERQCVATEGGSLGREMDEAVALDRWNRLRARFSKPRLVIVQQFEAIGGRSRQANFRQLFDAADTEWCLGLARHPQAGPLESDLAGRLTAGLVVTMTGDGPRPSKDRPTIARIIAATARQFGIPPAILKGGGRSRTVARARSLAMLLARRLTGLSYEAIGQAVGGRDHTTAMHAARVTSARLAIDDALAADADAIVARLAPRPRPQRRSPAAVC